MGVIKLTFDGANNTAKMDAFLGAYLTNYQNGIIKGLGNEAKYSISNGRITFRDGYVCVYGRRIFIEDGTYVDVALDSTKFGYVVLNVDTSKNEVTIGVVEDSSKLPILTKTNLLLEDGLFQLPICAYKKTATSITTNSDVQIGYIKTNETLRNELKDELLNELNDAKEELTNLHGRKSLFFDSHSGTQYTYDLSKFDNISDSIIFMPIDNNVYLSIPGGLLGGTNSVGSIRYTLFGTEYSLLHELDKNKKLHLTVGDREHEMKYIQIFY